MQLTLFLENVFNGFILNIISIVYFLKRNLPLKGMSPKQLKQFPIQRPKDVKDILLKYLHVCALMLKVNLFSYQSRVDNVNYIEKFNYFFFLQFKNYFFLNTNPASFSPILLKLLTKQDFLCVNVSKEYFPWYAPMPLLPIPPNGSVSTN